MLTNRNDIKAWLDSMSIKHYTINDTGTVTVDGDVNLYQCGLTHIPIRFRIVYGYFDCSTNYLKTLEGSPREVGGDFDCDYNVLKSLEYSPYEVGGSFSCRANHLKSLEYAPREIRDNFVCWGNGFETVPKCDTIINGYLYWSK